MTELLGVVKALSLNETTDLKKNITLSSDEFTSGSSLTTKMSSSLPNEPNNTSSSSNSSSDMEEMKQTIYDILRDVRDPEKPETLEELNVLSEESISVSRLKGDQLLVHVEFTPTVPHCSLASLIGLTIRSKLQQCLPELAKVDIKIKEGTHTTADEINKQINDKERIAAAMENPNLKQLVDACTSEVEDTY